MTVQEYLVDESQSVDDIDMADAWIYMPTPEALIRGGWGFGTIAGVFAVFGFSYPSGSFDVVGFRCARGHEATFDTWDGFCHVVRVLAVQAGKLTSGKSSKGHM